MLAGWSSRAQMSMRRKSPSRMGEECVGGGLVVGVGGVGVDADVGAVFPDEVFAAHGFASQRTRSYSVRARGSLRRGGGGGRCPARLRRGWRRWPLGDGVGGDLIGGEDGFKVADEIGGGDDLLAEGAEEFDGAGVDDGDVHDGVVGGVLHGDFVLALERFSIPACSSGQLE